MTTSPGTDRQQDREDTKPSAPWKNHETSPDEIDAARERNLRLLELGYVPLPSHWGSKHPTIRWGAENFTPTPAEMHKMLGTGKRKHSAYVNTGIRTGLEAGNGVVAVDLDVHNCEIINDLMDALEKAKIPISDYVRVGRAPRELWVYRTEESFGKFISVTFKPVDEPEDAPPEKQQTNQIEILSEGQQFMAFGHHPGTGQDYHWPDSCILSTETAKLPLITETQLRKLVEIAEKVCLKHDLVVCRGQIGGKGRSVRKKTDGFVFDRSDNRFHGMSWDDILEGCRVGDTHDRLLRVAASMVHFRHSNEDIIEKLRPYLDRGSESRTVAGVTRYMIESARKKFGCDDPGDTAMQTLEQLGKASGAAADGVDAAPGIIAKIRYVKADMLRVLTEVDEVMAKPGGRLFQRSGRLACIGREKVSKVTRKIAEEVGLETDEFRLTVSPCQGKSLIQKLSARIAFEQYNGTSRRWLSVLAPDELAAHYEAYRDGWQLPILSRVAQAPVLVDGTVYARDGFYPEAELLIHDTNGVFDAMHGMPPASLEEARAAFEVLAEPLRGFEFEQEVDRVAACSYLAAPLIRKSMDDCLLYGISAAVQGSGKTTLALAAGLLASGTVPHVSFWPGDEDEMRKSLLSCLRSAPDLIIFDNIWGTKDSAQLAAALTSPTVGGRELGFSSDLVVPANSVFCVTGNNLRFKGDLTRRVLPIHLTSEVERPETRTFDFSVFDEIRERRVELIMAALTVLRVKGAQEALSEAVGAERLVPTGSFSDFDRLIRAAFWHVTGQDICQRREELFEDDPEREELRNTLKAFFVVFGKRQVRARDIHKVVVEDVKSRGVFSAGVPQLSGSNGEHVPDKKEKQKIAAFEESYNEARETLLDFFSEASSRKGVTIRSIGMLLSYKTGKKDSGLVLRRVKKRNVVHFQIDDGTSLD